MIVLDVRGLGVMLQRSASEPVAALTDVSLTLRPGEVLGVVGESGAGKTMLGRAIAGLLPSTARVTGELLVSGGDVLRMTPDELQQHRGKGVAICFQNPRTALSPVRRVGAQVDDRLRIHGGHDRWTAKALFEAVGIREPERRLRAYPHELSGGMAQRVMVSLALACSPTIMIADEPTTGLDVTLARGVLQLFRTIAQEQRTAIVLISHDLPAIAEICDRVAVLYAGCLVEVGPTRTLIDTPTHPYTAALLAAAPDVSGAATRTLGGTMPSLASAPAACAFAPRCQLRRDRCEAERPALEGVGDDHLSACLFASQHRAERTNLTAALPASIRSHTLKDNDPDVTLAVDDVEVVFRTQFGRRGFKALRGVSLAARRSETLGIVGESGSGKSTLARVVLGLVEPSAGSVRVGGVDLATLGRGDVRSLRTRVQMVFQDPIDTLNPRHTVEATLRDSHRLLQLSPREIDRRIDWALERVGLDRSLRTRRRHEISGGQAQRVGIARALVPDPEIVVFDEPTSALDATVQAQILALIESLMNEQDRTYLFISHDLATIRKVADTVVVLYLGRVVESGSVHDVFERPLHPYTRGLLSSVTSLRSTGAPSEAELRYELELSDVSEGCALAPRCPLASDRCRVEAQELVEIEPGHRAACWRAREGDGVGALPAGGAGSPA
ncbi:MAG: ABC transporter ATP-binding protein [Gaiellales bacterium]